MVRDDSTRDDGRKDAMKEGEELDHQVSLAMTKLEKFETMLEQSDVFNETKRVINHHKFTHLRCLALGSPSDTKAALFQLAYTVMVLKHLGIDPKNASFYDPVFNPVDNEILVNRLGATIDDETPSHFEAATTLYFLPHAPIELMNTLLSTVRPHYLLCNDVVSHTDGYTKVKLFETYPMVSALLNLVVDHDSKSPQPDEEEPFITPKSRNKRKKGGKFVEPVIDYSTVKVYFKDCKIIRFNASNKDVSWGNAFSDLAYHTITTTE